MSNFRTIVVAAIFACLGSACSQPAEGNGTKSADAESNRKAFEARFRDLNPLIKRLDAQASKIRTAQTSMKEKPFEALGEMSFACLDVRGAFEALAKLDLHTPAGGTEGDSRADAIAAGGARAFDKMKAPCAVGQGGLVVNQNGCTLACVAGLRDLVTSIDAARAAATAVGVTVEAYQGP